MTDVNKKVYCTVYIQMYIGEDVESCYIVLLSEKDKEIYLL
jgi:hypothetical protein